MKKIILMRHAKSSWADPAASDIDRPLNARGRIAAATMGVWLARQGVVPDHIILSPASRCLETWDRLQPFIAHKGKTQPVKEVYMAAPDQLLEILQQSPSDAETVVLIGHQPGIGALARKLASGSVPSNCSRAFHQFPTAATAVLSADISDWTKLRFGTAKFDKFGLPKEVV